MSTVRKLRLAWKYRRLLWRCRKLYPLYRYRKQLLGGALAGTAIGMAIRAK